MESGIVIFNIVVGIALFLPYTVLYSSTECGNENCSGAFAKFTYVYSFVGKFADSGEILGHLAQSGMLYIVCKNVLCKSYLLYILYCTVQCKWHWTARFFLQ